MANALSIQFVVFTTLECHHLVHVTPRQIKCGNPVYLAYTHGGCGHYDAIVETATIDVSNHHQPTTSTVPEVCTCGKNAIGSDATHCIPVTSKYATTVRCTCLKSGSACTSRCRCRNCGNHNGKRLNTSQAEDGTSPKRRRLKHKQQMSLPKSIKFGMEVGEELTEGRRTVLEFFVLEGTLQYVQTEMHEVTVQNMLNIYNAVVDVATSSDRLPLGYKKEETIKAFLREHESNVEAFTSLCKSQLSINNNKMS